MLGATKVLKMPKTNESIKSKGLLKLVLFEKTKAIIFIKSAKFKAIKRARLTMPGKGISDIKAPPTMLK